MTPRPGDALVAVRPAAEPSALLTYDDGPDPEGTPAVLRELAAGGARATFFVLGTRVRLYPDVLRAVVEDGHEIGLHGADHRSVDRIPAAEFARVLREAKDMLEQVLQRPVLRYRPPYGRLTHAAWAAVDAAGMTTTGWTTHLKDWLDLPLEQHLEGLASLTGAGEILLAHDAFADGRDLVDDGPAPPVDRSTLARSVIDRISAAGCASPTVSAAVDHGTPVWRPWVGAMT